MKNLEDFGIWLSERMFREGGWLDAATKAGLLLCAGFMLMVVFLMVLNLKY